MLRTRRLSLSASALLLIVLAGSALARPAVSPALRVLEYDGPVLSDAPVSDTPAGPVIDLFLQGRVDEATLAAHGVVIGTRLPGDVVTARVPLARFKELLAIPGLARIQAAYKVKPLNDASVPNTQATPSFWSSSPPGFTGQAGSGTIFGLVDTGIDWSHDDFKKPDGTTRVLDIWDQNDALGPNPAGFAYGTHWSSADINSGLPRNKDANGHGSHVTGSAAGDGSATGNGQPANRFIGMAPLADIIVVATNFSTTGVVDGVNYIFQRATALGKPAVVNLSLGTQYGAHDGTETFDTSLDALTGPGRIIVAAAGNEGNQSLHAEQLVPPAGGSQTITFNVPSYSANPSAGNDYVILDSYYPGADNMTVSITSPGPSPVTVGPVARGGTGSNPGSAAGNIYVENGFTPSPSGDNNIFIQIYDSTASRPPRQGVWTITLSPVSTTASTLCDLWLADFLLGGAGAAATFTSDVTESKLVASPGSAADLVTVAAFTSKYSWPAIDGKTYHFSSGTAVGTLATFSSPGPLRNGAQKPDIAAPGTAIVSSLSSNVSPAPQPALVNPDGVHWTLQGTSMATPHVAGGVALLLTDAPTLTPAQVKTRLSADAVIDANTGAVWNALWGNGKLRMLRADTQPPTVTVTSPNGGEAWIVGASYAITWTASDNVGVTAIDLAYSVNNGASWTPVATGLANTGTHAWTIPNTPSAQALVKATAHDAGGNSAADSSDAVFTIVSQSGVAELPAAFTRPMVLQNRPNPFNPVTRIGFGLPEAGHARITIFSASGQLVRTLVDGEFTAGYHETGWDGRSNAGVSMPSGLYFYRFESGSLMETRRMILSK